MTHFENLTVKKIPKAVLRKCEWGHDDYSLEIENLPEAPPRPPREEAEAGRKEPKKPPRRFGRGKSKSGKDAGPTLFDSGKGEWAITGPSEASS